MATLYIAVTGHGSYQYTSLIVYHKKNHLTSVRNTVWWDFDPA